jgi:hypothetical protein
MINYTKIEGISMIIYLYLKQHKITGLLYFGKTINPKYEKYIGGGKYWRRHLKQHGKFIDTLCVWEFDNQEECTEFALRFSKENDIVNSKEWANISEENGLDGGPIGFKHSEENNRKKGDSLLGNQRAKGFRHTEEQKLKWKITRSGSNSVTFGIRGELNHRFRKICINNGIKNKYINKDELNHFIDTGFILGMKKRIIW